MKQQELISKLQELKQIKPNANWVLLSKNQILDTKVHGIERVGIVKNLGNIFNVIFGRKLAYSFAAFLFIALGVYGLTNVISLQNAKNTNQPIALLAAEAELQNNFRILDEKSKNLMEVIEKEPGKVNVAIQETKVAVESVTESIKKEPMLSKKVALEVSKNRTYLNIAGNDELDKEYDNLFKTASEQLLEDLKNVALPEERKEFLDKISVDYTKGLYEGKYSVLLEDILMFNAGLMIENSVGKSGE